MSAFLNNFNDPTTQRSNDPTIPPTAMTEETNMKAQSTSIHAPSSMLNAQSRKVRSGRRWTAAAAAWILAAGTLLGSAGGAKGAEPNLNIETGTHFYFDAGSWNPSHVALMIGHSSYSAAYDMTHIGSTRMWSYDPSHWDDSTQMAFFKTTSAWSGGEGNTIATRRQYAANYTGTYEPSSKYTFKNGGKYFFKNTSSGNNASISPKSMATSIDKTFIIVNGTWYDAKADTGNADWPSTFGNISSLSLGGQSTNTGDDGTDPYATGLHYRIKEGSTVRLSGVIPLTYQSSSQVFQNDSTAIDISSLGAGTSYTLEVWFQADYELSDTGATSWESNNGANYTATFTKIAAPTITDNEESSVTATSTSVGATINAGGAQTTVSFGYSATSGSYGTSATVSGSPVAADQTAKSVIVSLTGLAPATKYYYQWSANNSVGDATARTGEFTTATPSAQNVTWRSAAGSGAWVNTTPAPWHYETDNFDWKNNTDWGPHNIIINNNNQPSQSIAANTAVASLTYGASASSDHTLSASGSAKLTVNGGITSSASASHEISAPVVLGAGTTADIQAGTLTISGVVSDSGTKALTKNGSGTLILSGANTYRGTTTVSAGTLVVANNSGLGTTANATKIAASATLAFQGDISVNEAISEARGTISSLSGANTLSGNITMKAALTLHAESGASLTLSGDISGNHVVEKTGAGTVTVSGTDSSTSGTTVSAGTLVLNGSMASSAVTLGAATLTVGSGSHSVKSLTMNNASAVLNVGTGNTLTGSGAAALTKGTVNFDASGWTKDGTTMSWTIYDGTGANSSVGTSANLHLNVTAATGTTASEYTIAADGYDIKVTWTKATTAPTLEDTPTKANILPTSATLGGKVTADGNLTISEYGVVWGTSADPTIASHPGGGQVSTSGAPTVGTAFTFGASDGVTGLEPGETYHFRAYATNSKGTSYSEDATFTAPTVVGLSKVSFTYPGAENTLTLTGTGGSGSGAYSYKVQSTSGSAEGSIATGSDQLSVTACGTTSATGSFTIRVTKDADAPYASQYADVVVTVNKAAQTLTFSPASPVFGADVTSYTVTASGNGSPTITYSSSSTAVASINSSSGVMTRGSTGYGTVTITAIAAETANYLGKTNTVSVKVMGKRPTSNPATLSFTATATGSMTINFKQASDSTGIVLVMKAGGAPTTAPSDGSLPKTSAISDNATTFGESPAAGSAANGYVVYAGTGGTGASGYTLTVNGLTAGTQYYVTAYPYKGGSGTYAYKNSSLTTINGYTLADPVTTASATADGKTMVRLSWSKPSGASGTMVVWEGTTEPTQGTTYSVGATTLGGKVLYRNTGSSPTLEHVVPAGATYTYKFYAYSGANAYSEALEKTATVGSFASDEIVDTFSYTNSVNLNSLNGANGWSGAWSVSLTSGSGNTAKIAAKTGTPTFANHSDYPDNTGNRLKVALGNKAEFTARRAFTSKNSGTVYAAAIMGYKYGGNKKWCQIGLGNGASTIVAKAGRVYEDGDDPKLGIDYGGTSREHSGTYEMNQFDGSGNGNNNYLVVIKYDFSTKTISTVAYWNTTTVPTEEPKTWDVTHTLGSNPSAIDRVVLQAGCADEGNTIGEAWFDEVRVATSWTKLLAREATKPAAPTSFTVEADGYEMVRASVAAAAGNVIIVSNRTTTFTAPTDGVEVTVGTTLGNGTVVYKGPVGDIEMVVPAGKTPYFGAYAYNADNYYSTILKSTPASLTMGTYPGSCYAAEAFAYTNDTYLTTSTGSQSWMTSGKGWAGAWNLTGVPSSEWSPGKVAQNGSGPEGLLETTQLSGAGGNMLVLYPGTTVKDSNKAALLKRELSTALSSGSTWWGMFTMKVSTSAAKSWAGIQLLAGDTVKASIGKLWDGTTAGIQQGSTKGTSTYGITADHSYVFIFKWDGSKMWLHVQHVESTSNPNFSSYPTPAFTDADDTSVALSMADITHIQLVAENGNSGDSGTCVGDTFFDEIRFGPSFSALVGGSTTKPDAPASLTAEVDGKEMVRLAWTKNAAASDVIVVATVTTDGTTPANPAAPADGTSYAVGGTVGSTTPATKVLYKGGATSFEHVVVPGTKAKYAVYSDNGDNLYSSSGQSSGLLTVPTYAAGEYVETFSYTNGVQVSASGNSWKGGTAFGSANFWGSEGSGNWYPRKASEVSAGMTAAVGNYPASAGNVLCVTNLENNQGASLNRVAALPYGANGSGADNTMYFAYRMAYGHSGTKRWAGLKIRTFDNNVEYSAFVGKVGDDTEAATLGIVAKSQTGTEYKCWPLVGDGGTKFGLNGLSSSADNTYLVVGKIRWTGTGVANIYANAYWTGGGSPELPENEPDWSSAYWENAKLYGVNSIMFEAGSSDTDNKIEWAYFDELRFGGTWDELLAGKAPVAAWMKGLTPAANPEVAKVYIGDTSTHYVYSQPAGAKQSAKVAIGTSSTEPPSWSGALEAAWVRNYEDGTHAGQMDTEWAVDAQWTSTGTRYVWGSATGNGTTVNSTGSGAYAKDEYLVQPLTAPPAFSATADGGYRMTLAWTPYTDANSRTFDEVIVLRYASNVSYDETDPTLYPVPVDGTTYMAGTVITKNGRDATVVYRGPGGTYTDTGLSKAHQYYYAVHTVNNGYYSDRLKATGTTADETAGDPVIDGRGNDWVGVPSATWNSSTLNEGEFIWTDKKADGRHNSDACYSADIGEFRVKANADTVFFLLRLSTAAATADGKSIDLENTYVSVGVDTRRDTGSEKLAWLGTMDDKDTTVLGGDYHGTAAERYAERVMSVHYVAAEDAWRIEMFAEDGAAWYAPPTAGNTTVAADVVNGDYCVEWSVERSDLNLTGEKTARFSVATFANTKEWNGVKRGTVDIDSGNSAAVDSMETAPYGVNDGALMGSWDEGLKNKEKNNVNFWADVPFGTSGLGSNPAPGKPTTSDASGPGSPTLGWSQSTDGDGFVTGYLFELAEDSATLNGLGGTTENGNILYRVNLKGAETTSYRPKTTGEKFWWRVRARDNGGRLSPGDIQEYTVTGKKDNDGPEPNLLYVGTRVEDFLDNTKDPDADIGYRDEVEAEGDALAIVDSVYSEATPGMFGFVLEWTDDSGVYATNRSGQSAYTATARYGTTEYATGRRDAYTLGGGEGAFTWNILGEKGDGSPFGRVSPNWDLMLVDTTHQATFNGPQGWTSGSGVTNFIVSAEETVDGTTYRTFYPSTTNDLGTVYYTIASGSGPNLKSSGIHWKYEQRLLLPTKSGGTEVTSGWTHVYDKDLPFLPSQTLWDDATHGADANKNVPCITNFVTHAFALPAYDPDVSLYLTVSAEDDNSVGADYDDTGWVKWPPDGDDKMSYGYYPDGDTPESSGSCLNGPSKARNVTTNQLIHIPVRDDDSAGPVASTAVWSLAALAEDGETLFTPAMVVATAAVTKAEALAWGSIDGKLHRLEGEGQNVTYQLTDDVVGRPLTFLFNVYDQHLSSGLKYGKTATSNVTTRVDDEDVTRALTNTAFRTRGWNATGYAAVESPGEANPSEEGWYVLSGGQFTATTDTSVQPGTTYYATADDGWVTSTENVDRFDASANSTITRDSSLHGWGTDTGTVLAWDFPALTEDSLSALFGVPNVLDYMGHHSDGVTNVVQLHAWDCDNDREGDQAEVEINFGTLMLTDDDATAPRSPGYAPLGSGTNFVRYGEMAKWGNSGGSFACTSVTQGMAASAVSGFSVGYSGSARNDSAAAFSRYSSAPRDFYFSGGMSAEGATWSALSAARTTGLRYFQFDLAGVNGTRWTADTLLCKSRASGTGATNYALTVMSPSSVTYYPAVDAETELLSNTWYQVNGSFGKAGGFYRVVLVDTENTTASLTSVAVTPYPSGGTRSDYAKAQYYVGAYGACGEGYEDVTLRVSLQTAAGTEVSHTDISLADFESTAASLNYRNLKQYTIDLPTANAGTAYKVVWSASGINGSRGFVLQDVNLVTQVGWGTEEVLVDVLSVEAGATNDITMMWNGIEADGDRTMRYRMYGWGGSGNGTWGITDVEIHGISAAPKGTEVTDEDLRTSGWANVLEVTDGAQKGLDTVQSGLWIVDDGSDAYDQWLPSYSLRYPTAWKETAAGGAVAGLEDADFTVDKLIEAVYTTVEDTSFASGWTGNAAGAYEWTKAKVGTTVMRLAGGDSTQNSASRTVTLSKTGLNGDVTGATAGGVLYVRALSTTDDGVDNSLTVTVELLDNSPTPVTLASMTTPVTAHYMAKWEEIVLENLSVENSTVAKARLTISQASPTSSEVYVDDVDFQIALWGEPQGATAAANGTVKGAKFYLKTGSLDTDTEIPLSTDAKEMSRTGAGVSSNYTLTATVYDYDHDRTADALGVTVSTAFSLYDDDEVPPQLGNRFGGPVGVRLGGRAPQDHTGAGVDVVARVTDNDLVSANQAAGGSGGKLYLDIDGYDYSGWTTEGLATKYTNSSGTAFETVIFTNASGTWRMKGEELDGAAGTPSATNTLSSDISDWWINGVTNEFAKGRGDTLVPHTVWGALLDKDNDRADDWAATNRVIGHILFLDNDFGAPGFRDSGSYQLKEVFIGTNAGTSGANLPTITNNLAKTSWAAKSQYELRKKTDSDTAASRVQAVYDSELGRTGADGGFYIMANLGDDHQGRVTGQNTAGLQLGATTVKTGVANGLDTTYTVSNTTVKLTSAGKEALDLASKWLSGYSVGIDKTKSLAAGASTPQTWGWTGALTPAEIGQFLPGGEATRSWTVTIHAWDADTNRPNDQLGAELAGPTLIVRDDDTLGPNAPASPVLFDENGNEFVGDSSAVDIRYRVPWTNRTSGLSLHFVAATDKDGTSTGADSARALDGNGLYDLATSSIGGYWWADPGEDAPTTDGSTELTLGADSTDEGVVKKTVSLAISMEQGYGNYRLFAVDDDNDRDEDTAVGDTAEVLLGFDETPPMEIGYVVAASGAEERLTANPYTTDDPTSQFDLRWPTKQYFKGDASLIGIGPDDPNDSHHPTKNKAHTDRLSPWASYKIYYASYDASQVPAGDASAAANDKYIYKQFVKNEAYKGWSFVMTNSPTEDPTAPATAYDSLGTVSNAATDGGHQSIRLYDLDFDQDYAVVIVGVDRAGNEGPAGMYSWATNDTIKFAITQGLVRTSAKIKADIPADTSGTGMAPFPTGEDAPKHAAALYWMAAGQTDGRGEVKKQYDFIFRDAASFDETGTEQWSMAGNTVKTNWNYQTDGLDTAGGNLRFFRASYAGRWQDAVTNAGTVTEQYPLASEEVYSMNNVVLSEGFNYVSLQGVPWTNTFRGVFGTDTDMWPGGTKASDTNGAAVVEFYEADASTHVAEWYFFGTDGEWYSSAGAKVTDTLQDDGFFARPFSINMPQADITTNSGTVTTNGWWKDHTERMAKYGSRDVRAMLWHPILQVPTNSPASGGYSQEVDGSEGCYNLLSLNLPVAVHPRKLGLVATNESGVPVTAAASIRMYATDNPAKADKLYVVDTATKEVRRDSMFYCDAAGTWRFVANTNNLVPERFIRPNDMLILVSGERPSGAPSRWPWTYEPGDFYKIPTRHMGREYLRQTGSEP